MEPLLVLLLNTPKITLLGMGQYLVSRLLALGALKTAKGY
jgi:hypothetical protein